MSNTLRQEARRNGQRFYLPVEPCANGHQSPRYVSTGHCTACLKDRRDADRQVAQDAARAAGMGSRLFTYPLHPDDHAHALAVCQALDLARGRTPRLDARDVTPPKAAQFAQAAPFQLPPHLARLHAQVPNLGEGHDAYRNER